MLDGLSIRIVSGLGAAALAVVSAGFYTPTSAEESTIRGLVMTVGAGAVVALLAKARGNATPPPAGPTT